ncbi:hypothetical protein CO180_00405 [candidate division WWE3 bacterium CG_4_9_14_3_um_filter_41_6]|uniref:Ribosomal RNA adenine methylase transferase N-terminal domain-containing protein n=1 Tax=candidate division WWE3 bacterium CG_4_10_14_0_2_um_filter_41_14 TaxID=1975072 RepID=A0A2M7TEN5_UNCKA|nr:MAG: hypothetical protein COY32_07230 [candidate division WWE3 bacterium CG_4_10_14_0_2_um_filter_41_14]PJA39566.1 MAG: hypothetical protein CO180_00405 [candidate division WWE3 bacterium CG_4_9_14_3_um_filter_41_6]
MKQLLQNKKLSQVFLYDSALIPQLINQSSLCHSDTVIEIGAGKGVITELLSQKVEQVIAIEKDPRLFDVLENRFNTTPNVLLVLGDGLKLPLPQESYKVFGNIPFAIEGELVRRLLDSVSPPTDTYLVVRKQHALRWCGVIKTSMFQCLYYPWFKLSIVHRFNTSDFTPKPRVESVLLRIQKRSEMLLSANQEDQYKSFIQQGFMGGKRIDQNLSTLISRKRLQELGREIGFTPKDRPSTLHASKWVELFKGSIKFVNDGVWDQKLRPTSDTDEIE